MALPSLMQDKAILDTQRVTMENSVKQTEVMQRVLDSISNQRKEFNEYRKDFTEFRKSIIRGNDDRKTLTGYIQNVKSSAYTADKAKNKDGSNDFLKSALNKLLGVKNEGGTQLQQRIAEDTRVTREYTTRMAASLEILANGQSETAKERERDLLSSAIANKITIGDGLEAAIVGAMGSLGRGIVTAVAAAGAGAAAALSAVGMGLLAKMGLAAGAAMIPGNVGQGNDPQAQANEDAELAKRREMTPEHLKAKPTDVTGRKTTATDPRVFGNQPEDKEPTFKEKLGGAGEIIASGGLMFMKRNPLLAATMAVGGLGLKIATGEDVKPEDAGINLTKQSRDQELKRNEDSTKNSRLRRFIESNSLSEMKDALFGADKEALDARDKEADLQKSRGYRDPSLNKIEVKPAPDASKLKPMSINAPEKLDKVQAVQDQNYMADLLKQQQDLSKTLELDKSTGSVTVNNINTNNVSGGKEGGISWPAVPSADNDPVIQFYQKYKNAIQGL